MKSLAVITTIGILSVIPAIADDLNGNTTQAVTDTQELTDNNGKNQSGPLVPDKQLAEQRAQKMNQSMELKLDEINNTIEQQIAIRFDFELNE